MEQSEPADYVVATYEEIRLRFGLGGTDQARIKAKRRKWPTEPPNYPGAVTLVRVPRNDWDAAALEIERARSRRSAPPDPRDQSHNLKPLEDALAAFREEQQRAADREAQLRQELATALARGDKAQAEAAAERLRAAVAETELKALREALVREVKQVELAEDEKRLAKDRVSEAEAALLVRELELDRTARRAEQAEAERKAAEAQRDAAQADLATWTAGGPLARAVRAFLNLRGRSS